MKKIIVDQNRCIGCGACVAIDSEHLDFEENGLSHVIREDNLETEELNNAIHSCPVNAISISEEEKCNCEHCECEDCHCEEN